jgi:hypothetical protein
MMAWGPLSILLIKALNVLGSSQTTLKEVADNFPQTKWRVVGHPSRVL